MASSANRKGAGRTRYLSDVQMKELGEIGPAPTRRWTGLLAADDLKRVIEARFGVIYRAHIQTAWRTGLCPKRPPAHPRHRISGCRGV